MDTQHLHKREIVTPYGQILLNTPYWLNLCWTTIEDTCITPSVLDVPFLVQGLLLMQWQSHLTFHYLVIGVLSLSSSLSIVP